MRGERGHEHRGAASSVREDDESLVRDVIATLSRLDEPFGEHRYERCEGGGEDVQLHLEERNEPEIPTANTQRAMARASSRAAGIVDRNPHIDPRFGATSARGSSVCKLSKPRCRRGIEPVGRASARAKA